MSSTATPAVDVRRAGDRFATRIDWLDSKHSFSFGPHYDPANTHFGVLMVSNDDVVRAGSGFDTHPHRDMEIVTWVLDGSLVHQDSTGHNGLIHPGLAQRMSAGTGILHSEKNDAAGATQDVHFVQMWVVPDESGVAPGYEQLDITPELDAGGLIVVASGMPKHVSERAITISQRHAALYAARPPAGSVVTLPTSPLAHLFVARGSVELEGSGVLHTGDSARITASEGRTVTAGPDGAEVLVWEMHATLG
ncbi:pirin family protein [Pseudonocardia abyssalis]|uniref:Pirin family protein n=1 Tax=Pseudonocardia abyssalis TaxID=2792008 RepID=A0ABS6USY6_9PSEU|nr:pirin-like bicupin family protein [Pseudonocardia abyssalis]MBW0115351.1 pirin family protein [Pseudonocardia abyssalis]MBW0135330.1 pirin family protein [Pseudonocardia abyssalis]